MTAARVVADAAGALLIVAVVAWICRNIGPRR